MNYKLTSDGAVGTSLQGYFETSYKKLEETFGLPNNGDEYKVSSEWYFESEDGSIVTIYDYKETNLYDESCLSVEEFRKLDSYNWHIGAVNKLNANDFIAFLIEKVGK